MLPITKARPTTRSVTLKSSVKDFPDRDFVLHFNPRGITVRNVGSITWKQLISMLLIHGEETK